MKKLSRNEPCPCGSGKKYKRCSCWGKAFSWVRAEDGSIRKAVPLTEEARAALDEAQVAFVKKHGRSLGDHDPLFDPGSIPSLSDAAATMRQAGLDPALIYAFEKTGRIVTEHNKQFLSAAELAEWDAATNEYRSQQN